jgi:hypothetical protein
LANDVCSALEHPDSKIWENEKPWKAADYDWRVRPEITFDRWGEKANEAKPILDTLAREQGFQSTKDFVKGRKQSVKAMEQYLVSKGRDGSLYKALMGVRAPRPKGSLCTGCLNLLIKSAWMTNGAVVASPKRDRAKQLFAYGWT